MMEFACVYFVGMFRWWYTLYVVSCTSEWLCLCQVTLRFIWLACLDTKVSYFLHMILLQSAVYAIVIASVCPLVFTSVTGLIFKFGLFPNSKFDSKNLNFFEVRMQWLSGRWWMGDGAGEMLHVAVDLPSWLPLAMGIPCRLVHSHRCDKKPSCC